MNAIVSCLLILATTLVVNGKYTSDVSKENIKSEFSAISSISGTREHNRERHTETIDHAARGGRPQAEATYQADINRIYSAAVGGGASAQHKNNIQWPIDDRSGQRGFGSGSEATAYAGGVPCIGPSCYSSRATYPQGGSTVFEASTKPCHGYACPRPTSTVHLGPETPIVTGTGLIDVRNSQTATPTSGYSQYQGAHNGYAGHASHNSHAHGIYPSALPQGSVYSSSAPYPYAYPGQSHVHANPLSSSGHNHPHHRYQGDRSYSHHDHSLKVNTEYKEVGQHTGPFQGANLGTGYGYGSGYGGYNGMYNRPGF